MAEQMGTTVLSLAISCATKTKSLGNCHAAAKSTAAQTMRTRRTSTRRTTKYAPAAVTAHATASVNIDPFYRMEAQATSRKDRPLRFVGYNPSPAANPPIREVHGELSSDERHSSAPHLPTRKVRYRRSWRSGVSLR